MEQMWGRNHGQGIMEEKSWRRNRGGIEEEKSWAGNHKVLERNQAAGIQEETTPGRGSNQEQPRKRYP